MTVRSVLAAAGAALVVVHAGSVAATPAGAADSARAAPPAAAGPARAAAPNIVVIVADDWGVTDVGAFGGEIATPRLDDLARRGVRFTNFHVAASCSPTRSMLLTGVDNHLNGVGNLLESMPREHLGRPGYLGSLDRNVVTVATLLRDAGYRTYITGKWNVGTEPHNLPDQRGFDRSFVQGDTGSDNWVPTQRYLPHSAKVKWFEDGREPALPATYYSSEFFVDRMIGYLESGRATGKPFFAYVGFQANHAPLQAPRSFVDKYRGRYDAGWDALRTERRDRQLAMGLLPGKVPLATMHTTGDWNALSPDERRYQARRMEVYAGMAEAMDFHVGRLVDHLRRTGELERTVFVFLSDNGPEASDYAEAQLWLATQYTQALDRLGEPGAFTIMGPGWASAAASPFSTYKFYAGEGGIRSPMFISGAVPAAAGAVHAGLTHVTDVLPTLLDLAGVPRPGPSYAGQSIRPPSGRSLVPVLAEPSRAVRGPDDVLGYELSGNAALFRGALKLVRNLPPVGDGRWHLYDLSSDPGETDDLQSRMPEVFASMQAQYDVWAREHGVLPIPEGYSPSRQVLINSLHNYWVPTYRWHAVAVVVLLAIVVQAWRRRRAGRSRTGAGASR